MKKVPINVRVEYKLKKKIIGWIQINGKKRPVKEYD